MTEKKPVSLTKSTTKHVYGNVKEYLAGVAAPLGVIICWAIREIWKIEINAGIEAAIVGVLAGLGAKLGTNSK